MNFIFKKFPLTNKMKISKDQTRNIIMAMNSPKDDTLST